MIKINNFIDFVNEGSKSLSYSGNDVTKMPIIGTITCIGIPEMNITESTYDVVEIVECEDKKGKPNCIYISNTWYKPGTPQLIHCDMVKRFEPNWLEIK